MFSACVVEETFCRNYLMLIPIRVHLGVLSEHFWLTFGVLLQGLILGSEWVRQWVRQWVLHWVLKWDPKWDPKVRPKKWSKVRQKCAKWVPNLRWIPKWDPKCNPKLDLEVRPKDLVRQKCANLKWLPKLQLHKPYQQNSNSAATMTLSALCACGCSMFYLRSCVVSRKRVGRADVWM